MASQSNHFGKRLQSLPDTPSNGGGKRRNPTDENESYSIGPDDTVFRYLCPVRKIGSIIGVGGDIAKQLRAQTNAKIRISETIPGCEERVVTIYSLSDEINTFGDDDDLIAPAQHALYMVHDKIVAEEPPLEDEFGEPLQVTVRLLVSSDQIGCVLGRGGQIIQNIRSETNAQIRVLGAEHLPPCALSSDEIVQISGEANIVKEALYQVASRLHNNPSRSQHLLLSSPSIFSSGNGFVSPGSGSPYMPVSSLMGPYGSYRVDPTDRSDLLKEFSLRLVCPAENIGAVIGKGGTIIKQIRQESGAYIKVDVSGSEGDDDCIIFVSSKESPDEVSRTIDATMRLQLRCSEKTEKESGEQVITTQILVLRPQIGCLIGKGGAIISEMRRATRANIRILAEDNLPKVAAPGDGMVQITGDSNAASAALLQVLMRLRANQFELDGAVSTAPPIIPYLPASLDSPIGPKYGNRSDNRSHGRGYSTHSSGYDSSDYPPTDSYNSFSSPQIGVASNHGPYGIYSSSPSTNSALHSQKPPHGKSYGY